LTPTLPQHFYRQHGDGVPDISFQFQFKTTIANNTFRRILATQDACTATGGTAIHEMAYFQGMSHTEISTALGQPLGTVKDRIRTGMMHLRKRLKPYL
jgi:hypothetical protein